MVLSVSRDKKSKILKGKGSDVKGEEVRKEQRAG